MNLLLIGYRGTGKTSVAQCLALRLAWEWIDADVELEFQAGKSIAALFADDGEEVFRDLESSLLRELVEKDRTVLALGGGVILREENRRTLRHVGGGVGGKVVWLTAQPETINERLAADPASAARRPNLTAAGGLAEIRDLLARRTPLYRECADLEIDTDGKSPVQVALEILAQPNLT